MSDPWFKFYPSDWRSDPRLRMCSLAARGLWIEMIALMHEATPYGHLLIGNLSPTDAQLAVLAGASSDSIPELLSELESAGVFSRTREGVIYSRKMTRDEKKAAIAKKNGKKGGNPTIGKQKDNPASDNPKDNPEDKPHMPEAICQRPDNKKNNTKNKTPIPEDWHPSEDDLAYARDKGWSDEQVADTVEKFRLYWLGKADVRSSWKKDWSLTWKNWVLRQKDFAQKPGEAEQVPGGSDITGAPTEWPSEWQAAWTPSNAAHLSRLRMFVKFRKWHPAYGPPPNHPDCRIPENLCRRFNADTLADDLGLTWEREDA